jgi:hypothetical protein
MYSIIRQNWQAILNRIRQTEEIDKYESLIQTVKRPPWPGDFQGEYEEFWVIRGVSTSFKASYFDKLLQAVLVQPPNLTQLCAELLRVSTRKKTGGQPIPTLQFSYPTKLCHTVDRRLPIYDAHVRRFYLFKVPSNDLPQQERIQEYLAFYDFLKNEYARVLCGNLLKPAIDGFRRKFNAPQHTDVKIIDWLIWAFIDWADKGALLNGQIRYV